MLRAYAVKASVARRVTDDVALVSRADRVQGPGRAERPAAGARADADATARGNRRAEPDLDIQQDHGRVFRPQARARPAAGRAPGASGPAPRPGHRAAGQADPVHGDGPAGRRGYLGGRAHPAQGGRAGRRERAAGPAGRRFPVARAALRVDRDVGGDSRGHADQPDLAEPDGFVKPAGPTAISALQGALAAEHAAVYGYGIVGAMVTGGTAALARADWLAHQEARDTLEAMLVKLGATPVAASPAYQLPFPVTGKASAVRLPPPPRR